MRRLPGALVQTLLPALLVSTAAAQVVDLRLRDDSTRAPVPGAIVRLLQDSMTVATGLTDDAGRVLIRAPGPGSYRLKADRIGFIGMLSDPFQVSAGRTESRELVMPSVRLALPALVIEVEDQCAARARGGPLAVALWEEIRKALTANVITQQLWAFPLHVRTFSREVSRTGEIERERVHSSSIVRGQPFGSLPPDVLATRGFAYDEKGEAYFAAPDAVLLLSDQFVATHCFQAVPGPDDLVGLAFEPTAGRRFPDVRGTLWVDRRTSELQFLEYSYTGLRAELTRANLGGRVEFTKHPSGAWIVAYWHIRMPRMGIRSTRARTVALIGYLDQGGRAESAARFGDRPMHATITGTVFDSLAGAGLPGAVVRVMAEPDSVVTDADGRFELTVAAPGDRVVTARHPRLGLVPDGSTRTVFLALGDTTVVDFAVPGIDAFSRTFCGFRRDRSGLVGFTYGPDGLPAEGLDVRIRWSTTAGYREERSQSGPRGIYVLCELPSRIPLTARLRYGAQVLVEQEVRLDPGEFRWLDLNREVEETIPFSPLPDAPPPSP